MATQDSANQVPDNNNNENDKSKTEEQPDFNLPLTPIQALKDIPWMSGRFWVTHISVISRVTHMPTSAGIAFSSYNAAQGVMLFLSAIIPGFPEEVACWIGVAINLCFALPLILHAFYSRMIIPIVIMIIYHGGMVVATMYLVPLYDFGYSDLWYMVLLMPLFLAGVATFLQVWVVHKVIIGSWPSDSEPEWFPQLIDAMLRQYNGFFYILMIFVYDLQLFGASDFDCAKARHCEKIFRGRQYACSACCVNPEDEENQKGMADIQQKDKDSEMQETR